MPPWRRSRKRRRPYHLIGESSAKRREFLLHYATLKSTDEFRHLASAAEENQGMEDLGVTLFEHLKRILPTQLLGAIDQQHFLPFKSVPLSSTDVLESPSFCIGRLSLSLTNGAGLKDLLSRVHSMEKAIRPKVMLYPYSPGYLELVCDYSSSVHLSITASPPFFRGQFADRQHIKTSGSGPYRVQFVVVEGEREKGEEGGVVEGEREEEEEGGVVEGEKGEEEEGEEEGRGVSSHPMHSLGLSSSSAFETGYRGERSTEQIRIVTVSEGAVQEGGLQLGVEVGGGLGVQEGVAGTQGEEQTRDESGALGGVRDGCVEVEVWVGGAVCEPCDPSALLAGNGSAKLTRLVNLFHRQVSVSLDAHSSSLPSRAVNQGVSNIEQFYKDVKERRKEIFGTAEPAFDTSCIRGLTAELRGYQRKAVQWMIDREKWVEPEKEARLRRLHPLWREFTAPNGTLYCNPHTGRLTSVRHCPPPPPLGGILADEMGLGKTVEILALVMANRAPNTITGNSRSRKEKVRDKEGTPEPVSGVRVPQSPPTSLPTSPLTLAPSAGGSIADRQPDISWAADSGDVVECVCGATDEGCDPELVFVQCERCGVWQHSQCARFDYKLHSNFVCIKCLLKEPLLSRATLIISPQSILQQWKEEMEKHTTPTSLSVMHYEGVKYGFVSPYDLAECDVILVSYETLALELNYTKSHEVSRVFRNRKRYSATPSPLPALKWWRVCLDEAQMVESAVTKPAEMCLRLQAVHRWCVTGTPVQRDLSDLYGLVLFLGVEVYSEGLWYRRLITEPYLQGCHGPMVDLYSSIMWRNTKEDVAEELQLPAQTEQTHWLTFSPVERYLYRKQHELCRTEATKVFCRLSASHSLGSSTLGSLAQDTVQKIMTPLHSLRQVCCHPQMVRRGGYIHVPIGNKRSLTMAKLLDKLVVQAKVEAREGLRKLIFSLNGLAGLYALKEEWSEACKTYQQAITTWEDYKKKEVECDRIQRIHTLENLAWLMEQGHCPDGLQGSCDTTDSLKEIAQELRVQFMSKAEGQVKAAATVVLACKETIRESYLLLTSYTGEKRAVQPLQGKMQASSSSNRDTSEPMQASSSSNRDTTKPIQASTNRADKPTDNCPSSSMEISSIILWREREETAHELGMRWFENAEAWVGVADHVTEKMVVKAVNSGIFKASLGGVAVPKFREMSGILFFVCRHVNQLESSRLLSLKLLQGLLAPPGQLQVVRASLCHLSRRGSSQRERQRELFKCDLCVAESALVQYGLLLFCDYFGSSTGQGHGEGSRGVHTFEKIVHSFLNFLRQKRAPLRLVNSGKAFVAYIDGIRKEYDALRTLWLKLRQRVSECDELRLATSRMRFMTTMEIEDGTGDVSAVHPLNWLVKKTEFQMENSLATAELTRALGQVIYLNNLAETPANSADRGSCPICTCQLGTEIVEWGMLPCGHPLCMDCLFALSHKHHCNISGRSQTVRLSCPLCRFAFATSEVNIVRPSEEEEVEMKGNPSTKILGVVQTLFAIQRESPTAKTLVFSSWLDVLKLISVSLTENEVNHCYLKTAKTFQRNLSEFKESATVNVLLLPLHTGSKGLNITEATHVILVEPGLNVSAELQAIGRVHRMGQTKPTTVHRFMICDSVEEKIYHLLTSSRNQTKCFTQKEGQSTLTLQDLETLFN